MTGREHNGKLFRMIYAEREVSGNDFYMRTNSVENARVTFSSFFGTVGTFENSSVVNSLYMRCACRESW